MSDTDLYFIVVVGVILFLFLISTGAFIIDLTSY